MNEIQKFLKKLTKKERAYLVKMLLPKILAREFDDLDFKKLQGEKDLYRVRYGRIRIVFIKNKIEIKIVKIAFRKNVY